jgi:hypothetical protein
MIEKVVETWHRFLAGELPEALGTRFAGRDKEGARCRSGCQRGSR